MKGNFASVLSHPSKHGFSEDIRDIKWRDGFISQDRVIKPNFDPTDHHSSAIPAFQTRFRWGVDLYNKQFGYEQWVIRVCADTSYLNSLVREGQLVGQGKPEPAKSRSIVCPFSRGRHYVVKSSFEQNVFKWWTSSFSGILSLPSRWLC